MPAIPISKMINTFPTISPTILTETVALSETTTTTTQNKIPITTVTVYNNTSIKFSTQNPINPQP